MRRFTDRRMVGVVVVFALLAAVTLLAPGAFADPPCYHDIKDVPCPTLTMSDSCATQYKNAGGDPNYPPEKAGPICNTKGEHFRMSGYYGDQSCWTPGGQTGHKCRPKVVNGFIEKRVCGYIYKCKWGGTANGCQVDQEGGFISQHEAEVYELVPDGCNVLPPGDM